MRAVCDETHVALRSLARWAKDGTLGDVARHLGGTRPPAGGMMLEPLRSGGAVAVMRSADAAPPLALALTDGLEGQPEPGQLVALRPERDASLPGARLLGDRDLLGCQVSGRLRRVERIDILAYHPERRCVVKVSGDDLAGEPRQVYLKLFSRKSYRRSVRRLEMIPALDNEGAAMSGSLPVATDREHAAMLFDRAPGESLYDLSSRRERIAPEPIIAALAGWCATAAPDALPRRDLESERQSTLAMLDQSRAIIPALGELKVFVEAIELPAIAGNGLVHGDLHDKQLFVGGERVTLIDLDQVARGPLVLDIVNLSEHLIFRSFQNLAFQADLEAALCRTFLAEVDPRPVRLLRGLIRARLAGVYARRPEWHAVVPLLIALAAEVLTEEL